jgi:hypothetical protein
MILAPIIGALRKFKNHQAFLSLLRNRRQWRALALLKLPSAAQLPSQHIG